jgi:hypothetical protein
MHEVVGLAKKALVGRVLGRGFGEKGIQDWMSKHWGPTVGYSPSAYALARGWLAFIFRSHADVTRVMWGNGLGLALYFVHGVTPQILYSVPYIFS